MYDAGAVPVNFNETHLLVSGVEKGMNHLKKNIKLLNDLEDEMGWQKTVINPIDGTDHCLVVSSGHWLHSTVSISMFTHILRAMYGYLAKKGDDFWSFFASLRDVGGNVSMYQKQLESIGFKKFVKSLPILFNDESLPYEDMTEYAHTHYIHSNGGIIGFAQAIEYNSRCGDGLYKKELAQFKALEI